MPQGYPYAGILFLLLFYNAVLYFLWGLVRWRDRLELLPYLWISDAVLGAFFLVRVVWSVVTRELPPSFLFTAVFWLLGIVVVNTLAGGAAFFLIRGASTWFEKGDAEGPEREAEAREEQERKEADVKEDYRPSASWSPGPPSEEPASGEGPAREG